MRYHLLRHRYWTILGLLYACGLVCGQDRPWLDTTKIEFAYKDYPWAGELYLTVAGTAEPLLNGGVLTVFLYYNGGNIGYRRLALIKTDSSARISFTQNWGPLNQASQEVLPGNYAAELALVPTNQNRKIRKIIQGEVIRSSKRMVTISIPEDYKPRIRKIYLAHIDKFEWIFQQLEFSHENSSKTWKSTLRHFTTDLTLLRESLEKQSRRFFPLPYPKTFHNLQQYCAILQRIVKSYHKLPEFDSVQQTYVSHYHRYLLFFKRVRREAEREFQEESQ